MLNYHYFKKLACLVCILSYDKECVYQQWKPASLEEYPLFIYFSVLVCIA